MKNIKYYLVVLLCLFTFMTPVYAQTKASGNFKSYDKRDATGEGSADYKYHAKETYEKAEGNSFFSNAGKTTFDLGLDKAGDYAKKQLQNYSNKYADGVRKYVSDHMPAQNSYKNFKDYRQAVQNLKQQGEKAIANNKNLTNLGGKAIDGLGRTYSGIAVIKDATELNKESKHKHSSMRQLALTTRYMKVLYGGGAVFYKPLQGAATASSYVNDAVESDEFVNWCNEQDNPFLDWMDDITDKINDKAYKDACDLLEWLGINPPNSLPTLRTAIKPNIYLYPETKSNISVKFDAPELLLTVIPDYKGEWYATVTPDGEMTVNGGKYGYLFYESITGDYTMQHDEGFVVPVKGRKQFFTKIANYYGFNKKETNDFVTFWCSRLDSKVEYVMYPQLTEKIDELMAVRITPNPDNIFRVWFLFYENTNNIKNIKQPKQVLANRDGYEMVEWGGIVAE